tara:strand:- start:267 stop:665 length:399 start_codon:yes stop_codon:yes gene_type:complete
MASNDEVPGLGPNDLERLLLGNTGDKMFIIKFSAPWCAPCNKIKPIVGGHIERLLLKYPEKLVTISIDIDKHLDLYGFLKRKKVVKGVPAILVYRGTELQDHWYMPLDSVLGGSIDEVHKFFDRCNARLDKQ